MKALSLDTLRKRIIDGKLELQNDLQGSGMGYLYAHTRNTITNKKQIYEISIHHGISEQNSKFFNFN